MIQFAESITKNTFSTMEHKGIFFHSMFRAGSTYFFSKLRMAKKHWCYYEPFHHLIPYLSKTDIDIWSHSAKKSARKKHPELDRPHFYEYLRCFDNGRISFFDKQLSYDRFFLEEGDDFGLEKKYVDHLINSVPEGNIPVLQFNRTSLRLHFFCKAYPQALHYFLLRNPRDQFKSYIDSGPVFLTINLIIASRLKNSGLSVPVELEYVLKTPIFRELAFYASLVPKVNLEDHYRIFFYIWCLSLEKALQSNCKLVQVESLTADNIITTLSCFRDQSISFSDYKYSTSREFPLTQRDTEIIESQVLTGFGCNVKDAFVKEFENDVVYSPGLYVKYIYMMAKSFPLSLYNRLNTIRFG